MIQTLFGFLFIVSFICLIAGLIKPSLFSRFIKRDITRKKLGLTLGVASFVFFILIGTTAPKVEVEQKTQPTTSDQTDQTGQVKETTATPETSQIPTPKPETTPKADTTPTPAPTPAPTPKVETISDRDKMIAIFKADALTKWGSDYSMVDYETKKQTEAYDWIIKNVKYSDILARAKQKWDNDYAMIKYEYEKQAGAYEWINQQTAYPAIMTQAKQKWGDDYAMVKYEYEKQVKAYEAL